MTKDIFTLMWKERREMFRYQGRRQLFMTLLTPILLSIWMPWSAGTDWVIAYDSLIIALIIPIIVVGISIPDSFAGERERNTLETLLASRLPDRVILFGKIANSVTFGWGLTLILLFISLIPLNLTSWEGKVLLFSPSVLFANAILSFLVALLTATAGVLISLRANKVQQAQQTLMSILLLPGMLLTLIPMLIANASEGGMDRLRELLSNLSANQVIPTLAGLLLVLNLLLLWAVMSRFKRDRLLLD